MKTNEFRNIVKEVILEVLLEQNHGADNLSDKYIYVDEKYLAYNESYWQWEYDADIVHAFIFLNEVTGLLRLLITREHIKSGIGAGKQYEILEEQNVGNLKSPKLGLIRGYLKKYGHDKTRAGYPFPKLWQNPNNNYQKQELKLILMEYQNVKY